MKTKFKILVLFVTNVLKMNRYPTSIISNVLKKKSIPQTLSSFTRGNWAKKRHVYSVFMITCPPYFSGLAEAIFKQNTSHCQNTPPSLLNACQSGRPSRLPIVQTVKTVKYLVALQILLKKYSKRAQICKVAFSSIFQNSYPAVLCQTPST